MEKKPLTPAKKDELARQLQSRLRRERPRTWLRNTIVLVLLALALGTLVVVWRGRGTIEYPPLLLACADDLVVVGEPATLRARVQYAGAPDLDCSKLTVNWIFADEPTATKAERDGHASQETKAADAPGSRPFRAWVLGPDASYRRDDQGQVYALPRGVAVFVVAGETACEKGDAVRARAKAGDAIVYAVRADDVALFRETRDKLRAVSLPAGPVLAGSVEEVRKTLGARFAVRAEE